MTRYRASWRVAGTTLAVAVALLAAAGHVAGRPERLPVDGEANVSQSPGILSDSARIAVTDDETVHVVWEEDLHVYHRFARRGVWSAPTVLFYGGSQPAIATDGSQVAVALVRDASRFNADDRTEVYVRSWDPDTSTWSDLGPPVDLSEDGNQPDLAFNPRDGSLWVAWSDFTYDSGRPYLARVVSGAVVSAGRCGNFEVSMAPSIEIDAEGTVFVARTDMLEAGEEPQVAYAKMPFGGATCTGDEGPPAYDARVPSLAIAEDALCLAWQQDLGGGNDDVILGCRTPGGWLAPNMSNTRGSSHSPRLALDHDMGSLLVWQELDAPSAILFRQNAPPPPTGQTVTDSLSDAASPDISYSSGFVHAVWTEWSSPSDSDIHYARWRVETPTATPTASRTATPTATRTPGGPPTATTPTPSGTPHPGRNFLPLVTTTRRG